MDKSFMQSISAAVHIQGRTIRYAEVAREDAAVDLLRLGRETFEADVTKVLWGDESPEALDDIAAAVGRFFDDSEASVVGLVMHPLDVYSFFTPLPAGLSTEEHDQRVAYQAALVTNTRSPGALHSVSRPVRTATETETGEAIEWVHVLAVPQEVEARASTVLDGVAGETTGRILSSEAAAHLMGPPGEGDSESPEGQEGAYRLAIGQHAGHTEYALTRDGAWHHAHAAQHAPTAEDQAYYAVGMLNRIGVAPDEIDRLVTYGTEADAGADAVLESVFGCVPAALDPFRQLRRVWEQPDDEGPGAYVPSIGGALAVTRA
ncbi:hypothetical protein [Salinibacter sp.]|uniref:hypothetical protein n=1 Tax=Salinibacter sp. TaxID=2065818 RepID=UPI002FC33232